MRRMLPAALVLLPVLAFAQVIDGGIIVPEPVAVDGGVIATLPTPDVDLGGVIKVIGDAMASKNWALLAAFAVTLLVWAARKYGQKALPWLGSKLGGVLLTFLGAAAAMVAASLMAGASCSWSLVLHAVEIAFLAAGGWSIFKSIWEWWQSRKAALAKPTPVP